MVVSMTMPSTASAMETSLTVTQLVLRNLTLAVITSLNGTSNTIYIGEKSVDPGDYTNQCSCNWDEDIFSGQYGGQNRWGTTLQRAPTGFGQTNDWGANHTSGAQFVFLDGHVQMIPWVFSGTNTFYWAMSLRQHQPLLMGKLSPASSITTALNRKHRSLGSGAFFFSLYNESVESPVRTSL